MNETFAVPPRPPDYSDVYAGPIADPGMSAREILQTCLARQANNIVIGLQDSDVDEKDLAKQFDDWPIDGLDDVIIVRPDGTIGRF